MDELSIKKDEEIPTMIGDRMKWFANNKRFSDVTFIVGLDKKVVYGHKMILASGSPVFEKMFYSGNGLQMSGDKPIEIPDLSSVGFINMLKFIYGFAIPDFCLSELFETFVAADKYLVPNLADLILEHMKKILNSKNCCIIYDQLLNLEQDKISMNKIRRWIQVNSKLAFESEHFVRVKEETLVDLLKMRSLNLDEIDVLKAVARWVDNEVNRLDLEFNSSNKQIVFQPIKEYIRFSRLSIDDLKNFGNIEELLTQDETCSYMLHLLNSSKPSSIRCKTQRKKYALQSVYDEGEKFPELEELSFSELETIFKVDESILISQIYTQVPAGELNEFEFFIFLDGESLEIDYEIIPNSNDKWIIEFKNHVEIDCRKVYKFVITFNECSFTRLSKQKTIKTEDDSLSFHLSFEDYHCIEKIKFYVCPYIG